MRTSAGLMLLSLSLSTGLVACADPDDLAGSSQQALGARTLDDLNVVLAGRGANFRVATAEYITAAGSDQAGTTIFARDLGNRKMDFHFAPGLMLVPPLIVYAVDRSEGAATGGLSAAQTEGAIDRAMSTWAHVPCAPLPLVKNPFVGDGEDLGVVEAFLGFGGSFDTHGDIVQAGWQPPAFFDELAPGGSNFILGVTFTFIWVDGDGNLIDTNRDHRWDAALREVYYNNNFPWTNNVVDFTSPLIDVETVALHESGHAFSQEHFGRIFFDGRGTREPGFQLQHLHFSPRAVMNAIYWDTQRAPLTTDTATHCENWSGWH